ncbi:hypothetical protein ACQPW3_05915 [Actinosynnema sp. CA-248983]
MSVIDVVDVEATCWEGARRPARPTRSVEIGRTVVDLAEGVRTARHRILVRPGSARAAPNSPASPRPRWTPGSRSRKAQALEIAGLPLGGRHHSGEDDAWNIAALVLHPWDRGAWVSAGPS